MRRRTVFILAASVAAVALAAALVGGLALALRHGKSGGAESSASLGSSEYLDIHLSGDVPEQAPVTFGSMLERGPLPLRTLVRSIDHAAGDKRVSAIVLRIDSEPGLGWGKVEELRSALARFRAAGKPVYAHLEAAGNKEYYLATACSKVFVVPTAILDITGLAAEVTFFRGTLDKLGVEAQFEGIGKYKNAPNQFTEKGFTPPHREQMEALVGSLYDSYVTGVAKARGKNVAEVRELIDRGPYLATEARRVGLVDDLLYYDELLDKLGDAGRVTPAKYARQIKSWSFSSRPKVALIYVVGEIVSGESQSGGLGGGDGFAGSETIARAIRQAREDDDIKAIVVRVDSPGGSGTASDVIWRELRLAQKEKPVVASMGDVAASGGYYVSMGSDAIVAQPTTITGSIGVFAGKFSMRGLYDKLGVSEEIVTRGENAALFSLYRPWSDGERKKVRTLTQAFYDEFVTKVAQSRGHSYDEIHQVAQGRVWTGRDAVRSGLVDRLGGLEEAVAFVKEKAKLGKTEEVELVVMPEPKTFFETLFDDEDSVLESRLPENLRALTRWARTLQSGVPSARLPFDLRIH